MQLADITARFAAFVAGKASRDDVEFWVAEQIMTPRGNPTTTDRTDSQSETRMLVYLIGESFCSLQCDEEEARHFATRVLACIDQISEPDVVIDLLPLIRHHEDFSILVSKHARGQISRAGFRSIVKKRFTFDDVRSWLESASNEQLAELIDAIEGSDFRRARSRLSLPAA
jgi:hypothetical protein